MHAAWGWIDRWRKSTAFLTMTAEQQGLYRNLLDALWIFPGHVIPDDQAVLMKTAGATADEWARSGPVVLRWMELGPDGWSHATALEVIHQSDRRADKQRAYRLRGNAAGNGSGNVTGNTDGNKPGSPSPSPSPSPISGSGKISTRKVRASHRNGAAVADEFALFWAAYPRKVGKGAAEKAWRKINPDAVILNAMKYALTWQIESPQWTEQDGRFIPHPSTWLNQQRWNDEPT
jgi:uncharacterized protein YdaU (DUF1376 family)